MRSKYRLNNIFLEAGLMRLPLPTCAEPNQGVLATGSHVGRREEIKGCQI